MRNSKGMSKLGREKAKELLDSIERQEAKIQPFRERERQYYTKTDDIIEFRVQRVGKKRESEPSSRVKFNLLKLTKEDSIERDESQKKNKISLPLVSATDPVISKIGESKFHPE